MERLSKMVAFKDPELDASHGHTKVTTLYRTAIDEKRPRPTIKDVLQLKT